MPGTGVVIGFRIVFTAALRVVIAIAILILLPRTGLAFDSVSPRRGEVSITQSDIALPTPIGLLPIARGYRVGTGGALGPGWSLDIEQRLAGVGSDALLIGANGREQTFFRRGPVFVGPEGARADARADGWRVHWPRGTTSTFDASGREIERRDVNGNRITFAFDAQRRLTRIDGGAGHTLTLRYDERGALGAIESTLGENAGYAYDASGRLVRATDTNGFATRFGYDAAGRIVAIDYSDGSDVRFTYDDRNRVTERRSNAASTLRYTYGDRATRIARDDGYWNEIRYDAVGLPIGYGDSLGQSRTRSFDAEGRVIAEASADATVTYEYDADGRLITVRDNAGQLLRVAYDGDSARTSRLDINGVAKRYEYDAAGRLVREVSPAGRGIRYRYDAKGRLDAISDDLGRTSQFVFDATGNLVSWRAPDGGEMRRRYDTHGRVLEHRDVDGVTTTYAYSASGQVASERTTGMSARDYRYDSYGRLIELRDGVADLRIGYDGQGRITRVDYADGSSESARYDAATNTVAVTDRLGRTTRYAYDAIGRVARVTPPGGNPLVVTRDPARRAITATVGRLAMDVGTDAARRTITVRGIDDALTRIGLDAFGRVTDIASPGGGSEQRRYDADGLLEAVTLPGGEVWRYRYDAAAQLTQILHPGGAVAAWRYGDAGDPVAFSPAYGGPIALRYAPGGRLLERTSASGTRVAYEYDAAGRLAARRTAAGTWRFRSDANGSLAEAGDGAYSIRYAYDAFGRLVRVEYPAWGKTIGYAYDERGRLRERQLPDGTVTRYTYDAISRLVRIDAQEGAFGFDYDAEGRLARRSNPNGTVATYAYDAVGRVERISHTAAGGQTTAAVAYTYDGAGNRVTATDERGQRTTFRYDNRNRLVAEDDTRTHRSFEYGPNGERSAAQRDGLAARYRYDEKGRLVQAGETTFEYDANGNRIAQRDTAGTTRYAYDAEGRLAGVTLPDGRRAAYGYGPFGERLWREEGGKRTYFVYDGDDVLYELSDTFAPVVRYTYAGVDVPLSRVTGNESRFYHDDALGTVVAVTDARGERTARFDFDAFGVLDAPASGGGAARFGGRPRDPLSGLYDLRAREYDPATGSFIGPDPWPGVLEDPVSQLPYMYARANPLRYTDAYGLAPGIDWSRVTAGMRAFAEAQRVETEGSIALREARLRLVAGAPRFRPLANAGNALTTVIIPPRPGPVPGSPAAIVEEIGLSQNASMAEMFGARRVLTVGGEARRLGNTFTSELVTQVRPPMALSTKLVRGGGVAGLGLIAIQGGDVAGEISSEVWAGDSLSDAVMRRVDSIDGSTVAYGVGGTATIGLTLLAVPALAAPAGAAMMGWLAWEAGSRMGNAVSEGFGAVVDTLNQWDNEETAASQTFRRDLARQRGYFLPPESLATPSPSAPVSQQPAGAGAAATCPPGTVPAKDGSCAPETSGGAALDAYARATAQQQMQQQASTTLLPGDRRPGRVGPGDIPVPPIGGGTTPQDPGSRKPPQEPGRTGCKTNTECGPNAYCDPGSGQCVGCPTGQRANPDGSPGCIPIATPQPVKPVKPVEPPKPPDTKAWYGVEVYYSYKRGGTPCTIGAHKEVFGTRADANEALRFEAWNLGTILTGTDRTDVRIIRQGIYAGPQSTKPTYTGKTSADCK
jgi:RHS repeat-associated protein